jgi:hypothetical protein
MPAAAWVPRWRTADAFKLSEPEPISPESSFW